nr:hypothetical protein [uncultured Rhodopila sp.]
MADEALFAKLIVSDTGPLITLAAADSLDYRLYPGIPVCVPDAALYEATVRSDALGAQSIADWVQKHTERACCIRDGRYRVLRGALILTVEDRARMIPMTTRDFLLGLEEAHRINSADEVYRNTEDAGRFDSRRRVLLEQHEQARAAVERMMRGGTAT